jgi:hypothetical protein
MTSSNGLAKITAKTAAEVCKHFSLGEEAKKLLREGQTPAQFLDTLIEKQQFPDAVRFLAHALPKREAVWWACMCTRAVAGSSVPPKIAAALACAEKWVVDPSEENRRASMPAAEGAEFKTPAGCAAVAAFWSGGSLGPPNAPVVPPGEYLTAHGVVGAVMLAVVQSEPEKADEKYRKFLGQGIEVAKGTQQWK